MSVRFDRKSLAILTLMPAWAACDAMASMLNVSTNAAESRSATEVTIPKGEHAEAALPTPGLVTSVGGSALQTDATSPNAGTGGGTPGSIREPQLEAQERRIASESDVVATPTDFHVRDARELFATLASRFNADATRDLHAVFQFELSGPGGLMYNVAVDDGRMKALAGPAAAPNVTVNATAADYVRFMNGSDAGTRAMLAGRVKVTGNDALARRMNAIFPPGRPAH